MGCEHDYENTHKNYPHWRNALALSKDVTSNDALDLVSSLDRGLCGDYRTGRMQGLFELVNELDQICHDICLCPALELEERPDYERRLDDAYSNACAQHPDNKTLLYSFTRSANKFIHDRHDSIRAKSCDLQEITNEVLVHVLKEHAKSQVEPAVALGSRRRRVHPRIIEVALRGATDKVRYSKLIQGIRSGAETGAGTMRASIYTRKSAEEEAGISIMIRK